ncbi:hypothetical protein DZA37_01145 [Kangiella sp. HD9-110m-PIT-SAG06]|nr:hypothetical protein DZA37_01145 [Kangiella sp. HD9-110m-PIT-SAG06]RDX37946.1 hypothetical protein DZA50_01110 [Kangiella sp. HD9-110m-PIT-SAG07]
MGTIIILLTFISLASPALAESEKVYSYVELFDKTDDELLIDYEHAKVHMLPYAYKMEVCDSDSELYCFSSNRLWFSIPKYDVQVGDTWIAQGVEYTLKNNGLELLGYDDIYLIDASYTNVKAPKTISSFYYSEANGLLVANITITNTKPYTLILKSKAGFPK